MSHSRRPFQPLAVPDENPVDEMSMLYAVRSLLREFVDSGLHAVAKSFYEVAYDEESSPVKSCRITKLISSF
jgi:hypothetical protein